MQDRLLEIAKVVMGELDVDRVLTAALDGVIELCGAERGMILLFDPVGTLLFEKARNLDRQDVENPEFQVSRSIIRRVRAEGTPFFDPDLPAQPMGHYGDSVYRLGLMSVICLPMIHDGQVFGVVYLDTRNRRRLFTDETLAAVEAFSDFISLAAHNALERRSLCRRVDSLEQELREKYRFEAIVGGDATMVEVLKLVGQVAASDAAVLLEGESGTGKELVARAIHFNSQRRDKPFVPINCGALPETLQESELFGHERGAFTGAVRASPGWFERADGGTILLDEVGEMPPALQVKFLRVLETGEYSRLGSTTIRHADVRVVAATNRNLERLVEQGIVRQDLHYRLAVFRITLPPLRERRSDIPLLCRHFLGRLRREGSEEPRLSAEAQALIERYDFPGNVRELQNILQRAVLTAPGPVIEAENLPATLRSGAGGLRPGGRREEPDGSFKEEKRRVVEEFESRYIRRRLEESAGNITRAAKAAGIDVKNFYTKMSRYGIDPAAFKGS
jgi:Nif-specific regulatory protein